jgi:transcriptional regulator with XRE-family HTH domain
MDTAKDDPQLVTMQDRLNYLFDTVRPAGKPRYSVRDVAEAIRETQGFDISAAYINHICTGRRENPGVQQVRALATFFGVPAAFLSGEGDLAPIVGELEQLRAAIAAKERLQAADEAMSDPGVRVVALKARGLSTSHLGLVSAVLDQVRRLEGLAPEGEEDAGKP